jgi:hypothetical protein
MSMQMDAYLKKEQNGTLFVWVGAPEGGVRGWVVGQGVQPKHWARLSNNLFLDAFCIEIEFSGLARVCLTSTSCCLPYSDNARDAVCRTLHGCKRTGLSSVEHPQAFRKTTFPNFPKFLAKKKLAKQLSLGQTSQHLGPPSLVPPPPHPPAPGAPHPLRAWYCLGCVGEGRRGRQKALLVHQLLLYLMHTSIA